MALHKPTRTLRPPLDGKTLWSLISHLSLNYLSIVDDGKEALQKILELYNFSDSPDTKKQISGITAVDARRHFTRVISEHGIGFARGTRVEIEFDEEQFSGGGAYLFASVWKILWSVCVDEQFQPVGGAKPPAKGAVRRVDTESGTIRS